jgi:predicted DNA-binding transcriptional regulator AlpA
MSNDRSVYINARQLRDRYGGVSHMWVERKLAGDPEFPKPTYFGARRYWPLSDIEAWERAAAKRVRSTFKNSQDRRGGH